MAAYDLEPLEPALDDLEDALDEISSALFSWRLACGKILMKDIMSEAMVKGGQTTRKKSLEKIREVFEKYNYTYGED